MSATEAATQAALGRLMEVRRLLATAERLLDEADQEAQEARLRYVKARTAAEKLRDEERRAEQDLKEAKAAMHAEPRCLFEDEAAEKCTRAAEYRIRPQEAAIVQIFGDRSGEYIKFGPETEITYACAEHLAYQIMDRFVSVERKSE